MAEAALWPLLLGVLGAVFGSFIATCAIRWPAGRSALAGRSECDRCHRQLDSAELVPLLSWMALRGRCRSCGKRIGVSHPVTEMLGLAVGVIAGLVAPGWEGVAGAAFGWLLLTGGAIDFASYRLPNDVTLVIAIAGLATGALGLAPSLFDRAIGGFAGFVALWLVAAIYRRLRGRDGLGGGDIKLFGAIGLWLGWRDLPAAMLIASAGGLLIAFALRQAWLDRQPLGSLLAVGGFGMWIVAQLR